MHERKFKGILFDFDGTLAKTMEDHFAAWHKTFLDYDLNIKPDDYFPLEGLGLTEIAGVISEKYGLKPASFEELVKKKEVYYLEDAKNKHLELYTGVLDLIQKLNSKKTPIAIVTAGLYDRIVKSTPAEFLNKFNAVITGDKTQRSKPFPDPYLRGAQELNLNPADCIAVENAPLGVEAAKAAGTYCIAVASTVNPLELKAADLVVKDFRALTGELDRILNTNPSFY